MSGQSRPEFEAITLALRAALRPTKAPWAVRPAIWALSAASLVAGAGVLTGDGAAVRIAYLGVACSAVLVASGPYRARAISLLSQGVGAALGIVLGVAVADSMVAKVALAAAVALLSGMLGAVGRLTTVGALMSVIGVAFGEFAHVGMPGWEQGAWYLAGTLVVAAFALAGWPFDRDGTEWRAVAAVFDRAADLLLHIGREEASERRRDLATASQASRAAVFDHRLSDHFRRCPAGRNLNAAAGLAEQAALTAAARFASGQTASDADLEGLRHAANRCRERRVPAVPTSMLTLETEPRPTLPLSRRWQAAVGAATSRAAVRAGIRLSTCMTVATAVTCALDHENHSFWLPLTVAMVVRPEYASVFVRTVNRAAGSAVGALLAAVAIVVLGSGWPAAVAAAVSLSFAVLATPRLYGLGVLGVTCSALLSSSIAVASPITPAVRMADTAAGCGIAIVFGYLLGPGRATPISLAQPAEAVSSYLQLAVAPPDKRPDWTAVRDNAYQLTHQTRASAEAALLEPQVDPAQATEVLAGALALEEVVDEVTAIASRVDTDRLPPREADTSALRHRIRSAAGTEDRGPEATLQTV